MLGSAAPFYLSPGLNSFEVSTLTLCFEAEAYLVNHFQVIQALSLRITAKNLHKDLQMVLRITSQLLFFFRFIFFLILCMCVCTHLVQVFEEVKRGCLTPGAGLASSSEWPSVGTRN